MNLLNDYNWLFCKFLVTDDMMGARRGIGYQYHSYYLAEFLFVFVLVVLRKTTSKDSKRFFIVPTFDTKVTEYLCSGWVFFSSDKFRLFI